MRIHHLLAVLVSGLSVTGQTPDSPAPSSLEAVVATDLGTFRFEFAPDKAPKHVDQFIKLAQQGYYDGSAFHRVVANGIIMGGDPLLKNAKTARNLWGTGGLNLLASEFSDMKHERGVVSSVRIPDKPDSDGSQFFVCVTPQAALDGKYSAFGRVTEGFDVVERISQTPVDANGLTEKPLGNIKIKMEPGWAPTHVRNFLNLTSTGWYNGTAFHRISKDFVVQGGMPNTRVNGSYHPADRWVHPIKGEFRPDIKHVRGIVSMARTADPDSATTSFFLMLGAAPHLDGQYSAFGRIVAGMDVLEAFEKEDVDGETPKRRLEIIEAVIDPS